MVNYKKREGLSAKCCVVLISKGSKKERIWGEGWCSVCECRLEWACRDSPTACGVCPFRSFAADGQQEEFARCQSLRRKGRNCILLVVFALDGKVFAGMEELRVYERKSR